MSRCRFIVAPHSLIQRWLVLLYYLYYLRLAALYKTVWNDYILTFQAAYYLR